MPSLNLVTSHTVAADELWDVEWTESHPPRVVAGGLDGALRSFAYVDGKLIASSVVKGMTFGIISVDRGVESDKVVVSSADGSVSVWNAKSGEFKVEVRALPVDSWSVAISPTGDRAVTGTFDGCANVFKLGGKQQVLENTLKETENSSFALCVEWVDADRVVVGSRGGTLRLFRASTGEVLASERECHLKAVRKLKVNENVIYAASDDGSVSAHSCEDLSTFFKLTGHVDSICGLDVKNNYLVTCGADSTVRLWDVQARKCVDTVKNAHKSNVFSVRFSPSGKECASAGADGVVNVYEVADGMADS